ncbi:MAG: YbjN domain-containing protein [Oscillatoriales cyanobacterium SM2_1_8]|nr:YbjN domain-containing protein [Oscillatoriales cyanobacterium SM2_1_8]
MNPVPASAFPLAALRDRLEEILRGARVPYLRQEDSLFVDRGTTRVTVLPCAWNQYSVVRLYAPVSSQFVRADEHLTLFLACENNRVLFGKFSLDLEARCVWFEHALLGDFLDPDELLVALESVAAIADEYDERIAAMSGGERFSD